jgi:hypothetical protein
MATIAYLWHSLGIKHGQATGKWFGVDAVRNLIDLLYYLAGDPLLAAVVADWCFHAD